MGFVSFFIPSVISISVTVHFLISFLFPVNWSYLTPSALPFVSPVPNSIPLQQEVGGEGEVRESGVWFWRVSVRTLNLNHNREEVVISFTIDRIRSRKPLP